MKGSHEDTKARRGNEEEAAIVVDCAYKLHVEDVVLAELKSVENLAPVHSKRVLTYLRPLNLPLGLLINSGATTFKEGSKRIVNGPQSFVSSCLRVNQNQEDVIL